MNLFKRKKNGQIQNYFVIILFLVGFGFLSIMSLLLFDSFVSVYNETGYYGADSQQVADGFRSSLLLYDYIILFMMIGLLIGLGATNYKLRTHPMFFIVTIIESALFGAISYFFNYIFIQLVSQPVFSVVILSYPKTILLCTNLHWVALAAIIVGSVTLYAKKQGQEINYVQ